MTNEERAIKNILKYQRDFDRYTLEQIATRLNSEKGLGLVDLFDVSYFSMVYSTMKDIDTKMLLTRQRQKKEYEKILTSSAVSAYVAMQPLYKDGNKEFIPYKKNAEVKDFVIQDATEKVKEFDKTIGSVGYSLTDNKTNKKIFKSPSETYQYISNEAKSQELTNPFGFELWRRKIMRGLLRDGLKIYNYNQDTRRYKQQNSYPFLRNYVKNTIYQICQGVYNVVANQIGIDGVEISVHMDCALDHLPVQGHQFTIGEFKKIQSNEYFQDINGTRFVALDRAIGTWNCRHFVYPIIIGKTQPRYTEEQLQEIKNQSQYYKEITTASGEKFFMSYNQYNKFR